MDIDRLNWVKLLENTLQLNDLGFQNFVEAIRGNPTKEELRELLSKIKDL